MKMKSDKYLFMRNISRIRGTHNSSLLKNFPVCRNFGMLNNRTVVCRKRSITHDVRCIIGSSNHFLITCLFPCISILDTSTEFCMCKTCRLWRLFRNCRGVLPFLRQTRNITSFRLNETRLATRRFLVRSDSSSYSRICQSFIGRAWTQYTLD